jgi:hypothetical protein
MPSDKRYNMHECMRPCGAAERERWSVWLIVAGRIRTRAVGVCPSIIPTPHHRARKEQQSRQLMRSIHKFPSRRPYVEEGPLIAMKYSSARSNSDAAPKNYSYSE